MSAKDERAREILRGFKLYPPGSGAGPEDPGGGRSLRRWAGAGAVPGGHPRRGWREREQERRPGAPAGPARGGGERGVWRKGRGRDGDPVGVRQRSRRMGRGEAPGVGNRSRGGALGSEKGEAGEGAAARRESRGAVGLTSKPSSLWREAHRAAGGKVTGSE